MISSISLMAQNAIEVTGVVTDSQSEPLIGVSVVVKNKAGLGTITDIEGRYRIKLSPEDNVLMFSYIGFDKQEVAIQSKKVINIVLKESQSSVLTELVVTGSGVQKKLTSTGAITTVNLKELSTTSSNLANALVGNVAGVIGMQQSGEPGSNASTFWIRGISTFGANQGALILVDGFERPFNEINLDDIESFSILKDASATAIYGSKGANGVVLITTKKGEAGKININVRAEYGLQRRTRTPDFVDGPTYAALANEARTTRNLEALYTPMELELFRSGLDPDLYPNVDWQDVMLRDVTDQYKVSMDIQGGGTTARYFVSAGFLNEGGMYKSDASLKDYKTNANMTRWNYRTNFDIDVTKTTLVSIGVSGHLKKQNTPGHSSDYIWHSLIGQNPVSIPVMYSNGLVPAYGVGNQTNPWVLAAETGYTEYWENVVQTNASLEQDLSFLTSGLKFIGRFGFDNKNENRITRQKWPEQYRAERYRDRDGNLIMKRITELGEMKQESWALGNKSYNLEAELHYNKVLLKDHRIGGMFKYMQKELAETSNVGENLVNGLARRNMGLSGRMTYAFKDRYMAEFNFGYTGSENFQKGNRWGFFPAVSAGWNIAEEAFIKKNITWLELLKVRYSYGKVGNDKLKDDVRFPYLENIGYNSGDYNFGDYSDTNPHNGLGFTKYGSPNIRWEESTKHNLGFDFSALKNMFSFTLDIYKDTRDKIYMERSNLPGTIGVSGKPWANVGKMESKGFDGNFSFNNKIDKVNYTIRGNITYTKNEVLEYDELENGLPYRISEGYRWEQAKGLISEGLFKDWDDIKNSPKQTFGDYMPGDIKYKDINGDGVINDDDIVAIGTTRVPNLVYGFAFSATWNNFDFNMHFQGSGKSSYFINGASVYPFVDGDWGNILTDVGASGNRWISQEISGDPATENPNAKYPRLSYGGNANNYRASSHWLRDGRYLRLKTLEVGYTLPKRLVNRLRMSSARVYFLGNNLALWDKLKLWDPELASGDGMKYPLSSTYTVGLKIGF